MAPNANVVAVVTIFLLLEFCSVLYFEEDSTLYSVGKMLYPQPYGNNSSPEDRIRDDMDGEVRAIYGDEEHRAIIQGHGSRTTIEEPWIDLDDRFSKRNQHLMQVCDDYKSNNDRHVAGRRSDQFLINKKYGLIWCTIFKAASSSWLWNFNLLAGYTEQQLMARIHDPLGMARKRYPRPVPYQLDEARKAKPSPLTFIIVRHPFTRLISGFRDKILKGTAYYRPLATKMMKSHPELQKQHPTDWDTHLIMKKMPMPTFAQFVQYIIDERKARRSLNEHWIPMNDYCTPCTNGFDAIVKVETLAEDGNYIIYKSGIQEVIKPKVLNKAPGDPSAALNEYYMCQLNEDQLENLIEIYKYDLQLFDYDVVKYINCVGKEKSDPQYQAPTYPGAS